MVSTPQAWATPPADPGPSFGPIQAQNSPLPPAGGLDAFLRDLTPEGAPALHLHVQGLIVLW
jgi:hypothetical protein